MADLHPTFFQSLVAGGVAGTSVDILFFPIDTIKTRLQSSQGFYKAGGFRGIYKGIGSVVVGSAPGAAVFFSTYDTMKRILPFSPELAPVNHMISASVGEIAACLIRVPTEVIKTRTQTMAYGEAGKSSLAAARLVLQNDGLKGFYRGFGTTIMREIPFTAIQFPLYENFKRRWARRKGGIAAASTTPLDVLKTRVMLDTRDATKERLPSVWSRFISIYTREGMNALFSGVVPRTLWISAGGAVFLGAYEWTIRL
ncbi:mitochondrial carrier [Fistulina hepatica ATCC 64428]|uniref:Mitochondrial carrier n=1 Tax=Fistulina hepatica ATCC 64428 TaxID=1128425 RepID=A0A0D7A4R5_9AGAR|nr:mitochondrial carrier [Fistulina hepatica ATCC 64428]